MEKGTEVITKLCLWHKGEDIGNRLGIIIDTKSYVLVNLYNYHSNPVKLFRNDVEVIKRERSSMDEWFEEIWERSIKVI